MGGKMVAQRKVAETGQYDEKESRETLKEIEF